MLFIYNNLKYLANKKTNKICYSIKYNKSIGLNNMRNNFNLRRLFMKKEEIWELDFFSRPVVIDEGKKLWELIIVNKDKSFKYIESIPNNMINSKELKKKLISVIDNAEKKPEIIKFFRSQMFNMISIALSDLEVIVRPSRRTYALFEILKEREETVYPKMIGYKPYFREYNEILPLKKIPQKMPDILLGENFSFVICTKKEISSILEDSSIIKDDFKIFETDNLNDTISGIVVFSNRAKSLANWVGGLEVFSLSFDRESDFITMDCSLDTEFLFAKIDKKKLEDGIKFENQKKLNNGLHFISVMSTTPENKIYGFWLLNENINVK
uniref:Uncharacterized protein n=1 Tax=Hanusia phi TaxID=3032 RepID=A0A7S0HR63_9CRYP|mmetsp:Transcript_33414/g.74942  ORF Transcript_33414/g.74942 Transcript_33414/m.74942 type:complete len:326 (+) Transcript_33414:23-1000(+)